MLSRTFQASAFLSPQQINFCTLTNLKLLELSSITGQNGFFQGSYLKTCSNLCQNISFWLIAKCFKTTELYLSIWKPEEQ